MRGAFCSGSQESLCFWGADLQEDRRSFLPMKLNLACGGGGIIPPSRPRLIAVAARSGDMAWELSSLADNASSLLRRTPNRQ